MRNLIVVTTVLLLTTMAVTAADWPQWRGPDRNGVAPGGPKLLNAWGKKGPAKCWDSEKLPAGGPAGYSCPVIVDGRVYAFVDSKFSVPFEHRTLSAGALAGLGGLAKLPPKELMDKIEAARTGEQRKTLKGKPLRAWRDKWIADNLDAGQQKKFKYFAQVRLDQGEKAYSLDVLEKLASICGKKFANQAELDKCLDENGIEGDTRKAVLRRIPTAETKSDDMFVCLDAATGQTKWKIKDPGFYQGWGFSGTVAVTDGRCYCIGAAGELYSIDAVKGEIVWQVKASRTGAHTSVLAHDGKVIVLAGTIAAFDVKDGKELWRTKIGGNDPSPVLWKSGEKTYVVAYTGRDAVCIDPADGKQLWSVKVAGGQSSVVIDGDVMVVQTKDKDHGLVAFRITPEKAEEIWKNKEFFDGSASPVVTGGHAYVVVKDLAACVKLEDGSTVWKEKVKNSVGWGSPVLADGKLITLLGRGDVLMHRATPEKFESLAQVNLGGLNWSSAAVVDGKLYFRTKDTVACYDLTQAAEKPGDDK